MKRILAIIFLISVSIVNTACTKVQATNPSIVLKSMFANFAEAKNMNKFDQYFSKDFILVSNHTSYSYQQYKSQQANIFKNLKSLRVLKYQDMFYSDNKVATRVTIKLVLKTGETHTFYVILIARINGDNKISNIWEMTYPTWSGKLKAKS